MRIRATCRQDEIWIAVEANVKARADYFLEGEQRLEGDGESDLTW